MSNTPKKRILITGGNNNQSTRQFYLRQQLKVVPSHYSLFNCLVDMGYEVEQRSVQFGESLAEYDEVIVFLVGPRQLVATNFYKSLWAINAREDAILAFDDWQIKDIWKGLTKCTEKAELFAPFILGVNKETEEAMSNIYGPLQNGLKAILSKKRRLLVSAFSVDHLPNADELGMGLLFNEIGYPLDRIVSYNPNPYHRNRKPYDLGHDGEENPDFSPSFLDTIEYDRQALPLSETKKRQFNFASLVQSKTKKWLKKQGFVVNSKDDERGKIGEWNVDLYGSKAESQKRLTEDKMCQVFGSDWGCLMPGYDHSGSGWWRARPLQCADSRCILIGDKKELEIYYGAGSPLASISAIDLVSKTDQELEEIAIEQLRALYRLHPLNKEVQKKEIQKVLDLEA